MFEKEAEEYAGNREVCDLLDAISEDLQNYDYGTVAHYNIDPLVEECFKDGAEFGYNKANEWNYVKGGIFPKDEKDILCLINFETYEVGYYHQEKRCFYTIDGREIDVIAWKEIILPELEESESC